MTDISVSSTSFQVEKRDWLIPQPGGIGHGYSPSGTLDISAFTAGTHYANGYIPSGTVLARITATGKLGPYTTAGSGGLETAVGFLYSATKVPNTADTTKDVGCAYVAAFAVVDADKLPFSSGAGSLDTAGRADLPTIHFEN